MDELGDFPDPLEDVPVWTPTKTTAAGFFPFMSDLTDEIEALPLFSRPHIPPISLPKDVPSPPEFISQPLSPRSLVLINPPLKPICQTLKGFSVHNPPPAVTSPIPPEIPQGSAALGVVPAAPLFSSAPSRGHYTGIGPISSIFASIP